MRALDLFCGGGGAARGLIAAGFDVVGIDIKNHRKSYPGLFIQGDALNPPVRLEDFDFIWASPPCQRFSAATVNRDGHPDLINATRRVLSRHRWTCIENVPQAPLRRSIMLTGMQVNLPRIIRTRAFELSWFCLEPPQVMPRPRFPITPLAHRVLGNNQRKARRKAGLPESVKRPEVIDAMGLHDDRMTNAEIGESVPPAYAEFIAREALRQMQ